MSQRKYILIFLFSNLALIVFKQTGAKKKENNYTVYL